MGDFCEKLIDLVQQHEALYDCTSNYYKNSHFVFMLWEMIGSQLSASALKCKRKWKGLRDTYVRKRKLLKSNNPNIGKRVEKWRYLSKLQFLENHIRERDSTFTGSPTANNESSEILILPENAEKEGVKLDDLNNNVESTSSSISTSIIENNHQSPEQANGQDDQEDELKSDSGQLDDSQVSCKCSEKEPVLSEERILYREEDYHFMMSLLPILARLPKEARSDIKYRIHQMLYMEERRLRGLPY